ncbi:MAG: thymidine kinase [Calditrichia bacterium]
MLPIVQRNTGWIEVICGSMFSGKTEELIRRLRRATIARQKVAIFKPKIDNRYSEDHIVSHSELKIPSVIVEDPWEIFEQSLESQVVGIDEAQFFSSEIVDVCQKLANMGKRVIVAGLDMDYRGEPFDPIPQLLSVAEYITKTHAICVLCGNPANFTQRTSHSKERVVVGASDVYEARCRNCFEPPQENHKPAKLPNRGRNGKKETKE